VLIFWALINKNQYYKKLTEKNVKKNFFRHLNKLLGWKNSTICACNNWFPSIETAIG
jgi:hypothetical protein